MTYEPTKKVMSYLNNPTLLAKVKALTALNTKINRYLSPHLRAHCQVGNCTNDQLILIVANASIATQLRFQTADLLHQFRSDPSLPQINNIHLKVRPSYTPPPAIFPPMNTLYPQTSALMKEIAQSLTDPQLQAVMLKIAEH